MKMSGELSSHDRILRAAKRLFAQNGYENTSTVAIAREAGTSESQLMKHFGSKQGLLVAIFDRGWISMNERIKTINHASPAERLLNVLKAISVELENDPELKVLSALESRRVRKDSNEVVLTRGSHQYRELLDRILDSYRNPARNLAPRSAQQLPQGLLPLRGFGIPQLVFAHESHADMMARALKLDPLEFRRRNLLREGRPHATGQIVRDARHDRALERVAERLNWTQPLDRFTAAYLTKRGVIRPILVDSAVFARRAYLGR